MRKTVLVTGGAGYIGSHCVLKLLECGYKVIIFDNLSTGIVETVNTLKKYNDVEFYKGDLLEYNDINSIMAKSSIYAVMHFAAFSQVGESIVNPQKYYINNVCGALNLFKSMLENNIKNIVFSSTASTYGEPMYVPIDEKHPQNPINPYGNSKLFIEKILNDYDKAYNLHSAQLRYFNVAGADEKNRVGENHNPETHLIPNLIKSAISGAKNFELYGNDYDTKDGTCVRDYININDLVEAHILALEYITQNNISIAVNLGTGGGNSVKEILDLCKKITGREITVNVCQRRIGDPAVLIADNAMAYKLLHWNIKKNIKDSVESVYNWELSKQSNSNNNFKNI